VPGIENSYEYENSPTDSCVEALTPAGGAILEGAGNFRRK
jgi:hypothetical protein